MQQILRIRKVPASARNLDKPVAVGGDSEQRYGIILTKNKQAKKYDIKTGEALWHARQKHSDLCDRTGAFWVVPRFSKLCHKGIPFPKYVIIIMS